MIRLHDKHKNQEAVIVFGGPSLVENKFPFGEIDRNKYKVFLETKALTPYFLKQGVLPDYYIMFYPEKAQTNAFQHVIYQSFLADIDLGPLIKRHLVDEYKNMKDRFDDFFETWRPHKGPHKRFRIKKDVCFNNSPFDLLNNIAESDIITFQKAFINYEDKFSYKNNIYRYDLEIGESKFNLDDYFSVTEEDGMAYIKDYSFLNSSAIALFPLLKYMGFKKVYFLGMDMSMLGSMEYSAYHTFKSMRHYGKFFNKAKRVFNAIFKPNWRRFMRPNYEFKAMKQVLAYKDMEFVNVFKPFKYALPVKGIKNISYKEFING